MLPAEKQLLDRHERSRILPLPLFLIERAALVDFELAVVSQANGVTFERPRLGTFQVDAVLIKAATVAGALELLLGLEPVRSAPEVRANRLKGVDHRPPF